MNHVRTTLYFAYGSNIPTRHMQARCPQARNPRRAVLDGYQLEFAGCADVWPTEGASVPGVVWEVTEACMRSLDRYEGCGFNPWGRDGFYRRTWCRVRLDNGQDVQAVVYVMNEPERRRHLPSSYYVGVLAEGYVEFKLDDAVLYAAVERIQSALEGRRLVADAKGRWRPADEAPYVPRGRRVRSKAKRNRKRIRTERVAASRLAAEYPLPSEPYMPAEFDPGYVDELPVGFAATVADETRAVARRYLLGEGLLPREADRALDDAEAYADAVGEECDMETYLAHGLHSNHPVRTLADVYADAERSPVWGTAGSASRPIMGA